MLLFPVGVKVNLVEDWRAQSSLDNYIRVYTRCLVPSSCHKYQSDKYLYTSIIIITSILSVMSSKTASIFLLSLGPALVLAQGKRGLAYNNGTLADLFSGQSQVTWGYNWGFDRIGLDNSLDFSPMLWASPPRQTQTGQRQLMRQVSRKSLVSTSLTLARSPTSARPMLPPVISSLCSRLRTKSGSGLLR